MSAGASPIEESGYESEKTCGNVLQETSGENGERANESDEQMRGSMNVGSESVNESCGAGSVNESGSENQSECESEKSGERKRVVFLGTICGDTIPSLGRRMTRRTNRDPSA